MIACLVNFLINKINCQSYLRDNNPWKTNIDLNYIYRFSRVWGSVVVKALRY
jgi:hypothetical protein